MEFAVYLYLKYQLSLLLVRRPSWLLINRIVQLKAQNSLSSGSKQLTWSIFTCVCARACVCPSLRVSEFRGRRKYYRHKDDGEERIEYPAWSDWIPPRIFDDTEERCAWRLLKGGAIALPTTTTTNVELTGPRETSITIKELWRGLKLRPRLHRCRSSWLSHQQRRNSATTLTTPFVHLARRTLQVFVVRVYFA